VCKNHIRVTNTATDIPLQRSRHGANFFRFRAVRLLADLVPSVRHCVRDLSQFQPRGIGVIRCFGFYVPFCSSRCVRTEAAVPGAGRLAVAAGLGPQAAGQPVLVTGTPWLRPVYGEGVTDSGGRRGRECQHGQRRASRGAGAAQGRLPQGPARSAGHLAGPRPARRAGRRVLGGHGPGAGGGGPAPGHRRGRLAAVLRGHAAAGTRGLRRGHAARRRHLAGDPPGRGAPSPPRATWTSAAPWP